MQGNVYLQVSSAGVHMASEVQGLVVLPHEVAKSAAVLTCAPAAATSSVLLLATYALPRLKPPC